ncbi:hypothetical protein DH2020_031980 [Rehmannia glutinosa]|uniref:Uncharacterized protein n=1 Tax=Rehmannia glutinosa TaxID=99300 RepID=A0ABR0VKH7_REHGL
MGSLGASGNGGLWGMGPFHDNIRRRRDKRDKESKPSSSRDAAGEPAAASYSFPLKQAATAASLALTGDTIAQLRQRWVKNQDTLSNTEDFKDIATSLLSEHDWIRALRMTSYGFLLSYALVHMLGGVYLDHCMPKQNVKNLMMKVLLNQIVLGPTVIAVIFAWNNLWLGKLAELPNKYQKDALLHYLLDSILDPSKHIELLGGPSSSPCCFHVHGFYILELLLVLNHEQMTDAAGYVCQLSDTQI